MWQHTGKKRPDFAIEPEPEPGQESVWDYPRPPAIVQDTRLIEVKYKDKKLASTRQAIRILETASPPTFYLPPTEVDLALFAQAPGNSFCEWKGMAQYWKLIESPDIGSVAWSYMQPHYDYAVIQDYLGFYPALVDCFVDGETVQPQPGVHGGWVTKEIIGPYKGEPETQNW